MRSVPLRGHGQQSRLRGMSAAAAPVIAGSGSASLDLVLAAVAAEEISDDRGSEVGTPEDLQVTESAQRDGFSIG